jgi:acyl-CoA synthetase (AMP-forming)/AMP-acid ligase II
MNLPACINIADYLVDMARRQPHTLAVVFPEGEDSGKRVRYTHYTYAQLDAESDRIAAGLLREGIGRGTRVVLMTPPSLDFFALVFALFKVGAVLVAVDPGLGIKHLGRCLAEAAPEAFIGIPKAHWARKILGWARNTVKKNIVVGSGPATWMCGLRLDALRIDDRRSRIEGKEVETHFPRSSILNPQSSDLAAILFTSGSTGAPKGVVYTHGHFDAQLRALRDAFDIQPGEIDLATFPLFALYAPALGMTAIIPEMDFTRPGSVDPTKIARAIDDFGVTNMFGSPALLDRVSRWGAESGHKFPTLRRVISAGAPVPARVIERMTRMLSSGVQVFTPYGATESIPVASIGSDEILSETSNETEHGAGVCVGRPVGDVIVRVIRIRDDALAISTRQDDCGFADARVSAFGWRPATYTPIRAKVCLTYIRTCGVPRLLASVKMGERDP